MTGTLIEKEKTGFIKAMGLIDATMIVVGSMIGSGIFIVSADIARTVGSPGMLLLVWLITGLITLFGALSFGELAGMFPQTGGQYVYLKEAYNPLVGFLYGWTLFLVIQAGTIAAVAVAFAKFTSVLFPLFSEKNILFTFLGKEISAAQLLAITSILLLTRINIYGIRAGKIVQGIFTSTKTLALLGLISFGFLVGWNEEAIRVNFSDGFMNPHWLHLEGGKIISIEKLSGLMIPAAIGVAMVGSLFSSDAWNNITFISSEVKNPQRNIAWSMFIGTTIVTLLYLLANLSYLAVIPLHGIADATDVNGRGIQFALSDRVGTAAATAIFGGAGAAIMAILIMISTFGCNNGLILAGSRVYYGMANDGVFFKNAGKLNAKSAPANSLILQGIWASILCLSGSYGDLLDYVIFAVLLFYILTVAGIFILRLTHPHAERPYKAFGYPVIPAIYILVTAALCIDLLIFKPGYTWPGLIIVLLGIPVFFIWKYLPKSKNRK